MKPQTNALPGAWSVVALLWFVAVLNYLDRIMITTMRESVIDAIPMTEAQFGLLTSVFLWVYGIISPLSGYLADRFSRSRVIIGSVLVWSAVTWLTGHAKTFDQLLFARALMGISEACYIPAGLALIADYHRGTTRSLANGIQMTGIYTGAALGGLGGWLAEGNEWSFPFHFFGVIGVAYSVLLAIFLRDAPTAADQAKLMNESNRPRFLDGVVSLLRNRSFLILLAIWGLLGISGWVVIGWMPTFLQEQFHLTQGPAGLYATGFVQGAMLFGALIGGAWTDWWSRSNSRAQIYVSVIGLCVASTGVVLIVTSNSLVPALIGLIVFSLPRVFIDSNIMPILCRVCDFRYRATGFGILNLCASMVGGLSIYLGGALRDVKINLSFTFLLAAASVLLCAGLLCFVKQSPIVER